MLTSPQKIRTPPNNAHRAEKMAVLMADVLNTGPSMHTGLWLTWSPIPQLHPMIGIVHSIVVPHRQLL